MFIVHAEHRIRDYDLWKAAFDRDPLHREDSGMHRYRIARSVNDPHYLTMDFEFEEVVAAEAFAAALHELWISRTAAPALLGR
ncbi:MAG: hypothetical protein JOY78_18700, partial [Pseudonocardia sp.]|nr:hypothetical protein [Pseudonocardia sp.]